jgi:stress-induced morphogen
MRSSLVSTIARPIKLSAPRTLRTFTTTTPRYYSTDAEGSSMTETESSIADLLRSNLTGPITHLLVQDISGGCGSMYAIEVTAEDFRGKTMLKQQRMVNAALGEVIKGWHGVQIRTMVPEA